MPIVLKSGNLNLLEPSGPVQACNGIALPLPFLFVGKCANVIITRDFIFAFVSLIEFTLYCHTANTAVSEPGVAVTIIQELKYAV